MSPRNYFSFTPLLPSPTCGTVEARSIVEPIRNIIKKKNGQIQFREAECVKIDATNKKVICHSNDDTVLGKTEIFLDYNYLVIATWAQVNTFNTSGVIGHCHFLKEVEDAQKIRRSVISCFEKADLPNNLVRITVVQFGDHILNMFGERVSTFAEHKFQRDGIKVKTECRVLGVSEKEIVVKVKSEGIVSSIPYGMVVWSAGTGTRHVIRNFMEQIGQSKRRFLATDEWLRVEGCDSVYALGDCATIHQRKVMEDISTIFSAADKDNSGTLTVKEFQDVIKDILVKYPQLELYLKNKHLRSAKDLLKDSQGNDMKEVAAQHGTYLARCFNHMEEYKTSPEGPLRFKESGRHQFRPFRYKHFGQFAPLGGEQTAAELPGDWVSMGHRSQWLWYSVYLSKQVTWHTRVLVVSDWTRRFIFGRDSSCI
ncbi:hypothetical protein GIB67_039874 [Kingdonia uniflora]|uniref:NADH:ubiquinone reductase (non-electrogenic) n=1 Tax=Kingdonia uniflora TaxID=39325 RepID=A0A7J7P3N1_9MAGN|nr:hypothetical protein GIB67_039874 [Kingdonia uniflora]